MKIIKICFICLFFITPGFGTYNNCISATFGIPDYFNLKYTREFGTLSVGITSGANPNLSILIPGLDIGYRVYQYNTISLCMSLITAYWPRMSRVVPDCSCGKGYQTDWLQLAIRPDLGFDIKRVRIRAGAGYDQIVEITRSDSGEDASRFRAFISCNVSIGFLF